MVVLAAGVTHAGAQDAGLAADEVRVPTRDGRHRYADVDPRPEPGSHRPALHERFTAYLSQGKLITPDRAVSALLAHLLTDDATGRLWT
jgi:hypothetical protein